MPEVLHKVESSRYAITEIALPVSVLETSNSCSGCMACRRLAELREQLKDARAEQKADAAAYANTLETQQVLGALNVAPCSRPITFLPMRKFPQHDWVKV